MVELEVVRSGSVCFRCLRKFWFCVGDISFNFRLDGKHLLLRAFLEGEEFAYIWAFSLFDFADVISK